MKKHHENMGLTQDEVDEATEQQIEEMVREIRSIRSKMDEIRQECSELCDGAPDANGTAKLANQILHILDR